jgi:hypothetical protein
MVYPDETTYPGPELYAGLLVDEPPPDPEPDPLPVLPVCPVRPRAVLRGDLGWRPRITVLLDGDRRPDLVPVPIPSLPGTDRLLKSFTVRKRTITGEDVDGNSLYGWEDLFTQIALSWETRTEVDAAGVTVVRAQLLIANPSDVSIDESAVVLDVDTDELWRVTQVADLPDAARLQLDRVTYG